MENFERRNAIREIAELECREAQLQTQQEDNVAGILPTRPTNSPTANRQSPDWRPAPVSRANPDLPLRFRRLPRNEKARKLRAFRGFCCTVSGYTETPQTAWRSETDSNPRYAIALQAPEFSAYISAPEKPEITICIFCGFLQSPENPRFAMLRHSDDVDAKWRIMSGNWQRGHDRGIQALGDN